MSMMARFVAIAPDQLAAIKDSPELVEGLLTQTAGLPLVNPLDLVERLRRHAPQLVADTFAQLPPEARQQLRQQLGLGEDGLPHPAPPTRCYRNGRSARSDSARHPGPPAKVSRSTRRGTGFITCCAERRNRPLAPSDRPCSAGPKAARTRVMGPRAISR